MKSNRNVIFGLMVVALSLSALFLFSCRGSAWEVPAGRTIPSPDARTSFAGPVAVAFEEPGGDPAAGFQDITLERSLPSDTLLPASVSFNIGSRRYSSNGVPHTMDVAPVIRDNRAYLPVVYMGYAIGMVDNDIIWNPGTRTVSLNFDTHTVTFTLGSPIYTVDGAAHIMDVAPLIVSGHMDVPPAYFAGAFGYNVVENQGADPAPQLGQDPGSGDVFVVVDTKIPEQLYVCRGSSVILATYCNTGVPEAPTPTGVFKVFAKLPTDTMTGKNPDGTKYFDPDVPWVMYFDGGCAIHGFVRARYGFPQSVGCVELPVAVARKVYDLVPIGTRVFIR